MDDVQWVTHSFTTFDYGTVDQPSTIDNRQERPQKARGSFASFVCHVTNLERKLQISNPIVLDDSSTVRSTGKILGEGKTFMVRHALWTKDPTEPPLDIALKEIVPDFDTSDNSSRSGSDGTHKSQIDWKEILFEIRALLHEPIRYHPNIVRLLGIQWGLSHISESTLPVLLVEYAPYGTLQSLQASSQPLPLAEKQKLCYDVGRGLSSLHASGIIHGDLKHENVLIFPFRGTEKDQTEDSHSIRYTAKLADFGGAVMDMTSWDTRKLETGTWPFEAPEVISGRLLKKSDMKLADVYSFGLLAWRAFEDGNGFVSLPGAIQCSPDEERRSLTHLKDSDQLTGSAIRSIQSYATSHGVPQSFVEMFTYVILQTIRLDPKERSLVKAQASLRGIRLGAITGYLEFVRETNDTHEVPNFPPGAHGIHRDKLQFFLGQSGKDADLQDNLPGFRPQLDEPNAEEFTFEPLKLKHILTWKQQQQMLDELKTAASDDRASSSNFPDLKKTVAAFYVFQCYLLEFGTTFQGDQASQWLLQASSDDDSHEDEDYLAQAWIWRISRALGANISTPQQKLQSLLQLSVMRGHRTSLEDIYELALVGAPDERQHWWNVYLQSRHLLLSQMGAVGMGYFYSSHLTPPWNRLNLRDPASWDATIRTVLGDRYESSLRSYEPSPGDTSSSTRDYRNRTLFDRVYINRRGHGPLHYAAATSTATILEHLMITYECTLDLPNQHVDETPLVCACAAGNLETALFLLDNGADPNGHWTGQEGPLHWLCSFLPDQMEIIARRLIDAGAEIEYRSRDMRHDVRGIRSDWEHIFEIPATPLGRAVLMNNAKAVQVLLQLGADPLAKSAVKHKGEWEGLDGMSKRRDIASPFELAAILTYPEILALFITHIDGNTNPPTIKLLSEIGMLDLARNKRITPHDPLSLQSRLVRCGSRYQQNMKLTLMILFARALPFTGNMVSEELQKQRSEVLCQEVALGNADIVQTLLELGYYAGGTLQHRPIEAAVKLNHFDLFVLLRRHNADLAVTRLTPRGAISLLHICASRPRQSRPGRFIADTLISAGVPVASADPRIKPPLALAILHQNFDVAAALIENGANVDALYPIDTIQPPSLTSTNATVLVEVLSEHTMRTIESLKFLLGHCEDSPAQRPAFHIDSSRRFSVFHLLAGSPVFTQIAQITPKILKLCLETYREADLINYRHPILGTALSYAAASGHKAMVERLLQYDADESADAGPVLGDSVQALIRPATSWTPLWTAILRLDEEFRKGMLLPSEEAPHEWIRSGTVQNLEKCVALLLVNSTDKLALKAAESLREKNKAVEGAEREWRKERANEKSVGGNERERPLWLSFLPASASESDEKRIREICEASGDDWKTEEIQKILGELQL